MSIHELADEPGQRHVLVMKGAPECIVDRCVTILVDGLEHQLDDSWRQTLNEALLQFAGLAERVVAFCDLLLPPDQYPLGYQVVSCEVQRN